MILKIHENQEKKIVAVCDSELKGKKFEDYTLSDKNIKRMRERSGKN